LLLKKYLDRLRKISEVAFKAIDSTFKGDEFALKTATAKLENLSFLK
jgi:hypothetical protein